MRKKILLGSSEIITVVCEKLQSRKTFIVHLLLRHLGNFEHLHIHFRLNARYMGKQESFLTSSDCFSSLAPS